MVESLSLLHRAKSRKRAGRVVHLLWKKPTIGRAYMLCADIGYKPSRGTILPENGLYLLVF